MIKLTKDILLFTDLFEDLDKIFLNLTELDWKMWGRNNNDPNYRIGEIGIIDNNEYLSTQIKSATQKCLDDYMLELDIDNGLYYHDQYGLYVRKWDFPMAGMSAHRDYTYDDQGGIKKVAYTICGYLNDDYEGGLIEFPEHDLSIKPPAGSAIVFNSNELHLVTDLKDKHRYMWSCFVYNK